MPRIDAALSPAQRIEVRQAYKLVEGTGVALLEAVRRGLEGKRAPNRATVDQAIELFLSSRVDEDCRPATIDFYSDFLRPISKKFGIREIDTVTADELSHCIDVATLGRTARTSIARAARALWRWSMRQRPPMASVDVTLGLRFVPAKKEGKEPEILTVDACAKLLKTKSHFRPAIALMLYAGIRPEEIHGPDKPPMLWSDVHIEEGKIIVRAECAKTREKRVIEDLPGSIWQWLEPQSPDKPICAPRARQIIKWAKKTLGYAKNQSWHQDATRHTFASYMLAVTKNPGQVSLWLGHGGDIEMLMAHYNKPGQRAPGLKFLAICNEGATSALPLPSPSSS